MTEHDQQTECESSRAEPTPIEHQPDREVEGPKAELAPSNLEPDWPVSKDGPHAIGRERRWLAGKLMDSKLTDEEAFSIVAFHPDIKDRARAAETLRADKAEARVRQLEAGLKPFATHEPDLWGISETFDNITLVHSSGTLASQYNLLVSNFIIARALLENRDD